MAERKLLLIDGDQFLYRGCVAVETDVRWDEENHMLFSNFPEAWHNVKAGIDGLFERFGTDNHVIALTSKTNFRRDIDPTYKGNRKGQRKPLCYARCVEQLKADYKTYCFDGLEADDVMGILATRVKGSVICSMDKDMKTIPATIFNGTDVFSVSEAEADYFHLYQTLVGDTADGYPGCPGVGPKKAELILANEADRWKAVVAAYVKAGLTEEDALRQARLARILRDSDWDANKKEPILWTP